MAVYVEDTFTVASDTAIASHTPDTGTGYTVVSDTTITPPVVQATDDFVEKASLENDTEYVASAEPDPDTDEYYVEGLIVNAPGDLITSSYTFGFFARRDATDRYMMQILPESHIEASHKILKDVSGTPSLLASSDVGGTVNDACNQFYQFRITDARKSIVREGVELCSTTDDTVAGGDCGFGWGNWFPDGNHTASSWAMDDFRTLDVPQESVPSADDTDGNWTNKAGSATDIYADMDEDRADDDTTYAESGDSPNLDILKVKIATASDPSTGDSHYVHARYRQQGGETIDLRVRLLEDTTEIATWTYTSIASTFFYVRELLSTTEANNITDYSDLYLEFRADVP
jgi:hypothetical protein